MLCASSCVFFKYALGIAVMFLVCKMDIGNAGVISRQVYYLILCSTALTFPATPVLWRFSKRWLPPVVTIKTTGSSPSEGGCIDLEDASLLAGLGGSKQE